MRWRWAVREEEREQEGKKINKGWLFFTDDRAAVQARLEAGVSK